VMTNDVNNINEVWPVRPNPGTNRSYQFGVTRPSNGTLVQVTAACTPMVYRGDRLPPELYGNVFVAEPAGNFVRRIVLEDDGTTLRARNAYDKAEFFSSTDERFRPVFISNAPDGTFMVVDFYRGVLQDRASTTLYLKDYIQKRKLDAPTGVGRGRVFRIVHESTQRDTTKPQLSRATPAQLVEALSHANGWWRDTAQRLLVERSGVKVAAELKALAGGAAPPRTRVKALWILDGIDNIDVATVTKALTDPSRDVRTSAVRLAERWLGEASSPMQDAIVKLIDDPDWQVREQVAASLGAIGAGQKETAIALLLQKHADDPVAADAALSGARGSEPVILEKLLQTNAPQTLAHEAAIAMVSATIVRAGQDASIQTTLAAVADPTRPGWQRSAVLRGAEVAVVPNTPMPGNAARGAAPSITATATATPGAPCPTCPGGRAGPGGAYAFDDMRPQAATTPTAGGGRGGGPGGRGAGGGRGRGGPRLQIGREPSAFVALAGGADPLASRAANVLARIEWPGKPGAANPATPLTAAEQQRFEAGREVYRNICQACHQPDGRGLTRVAPPLVGSVLALAPAEITARIVLNGKEGPVGLMPPIGTTLTNDQIASVLTYVRREWGQTGDPVDPRTVETVRAQTATRTRPWTDDELLAMMPGGRGAQ